MQNRIKINDTTIERDTERERENESLFSIAKQIVTRLRNQGAQKRNCKFFVSNLFHS